MTSIGLIAADQLGYNDKADFVTVTGTIMKIKKDMLNMYKV